MSALRAPRSDISQDSYGGRPLRVYTSVMSRFLVLALVTLTTPLFAQSWTQWGGNSRHTGSLAVQGQSFRKQLADIIYDPFVPQERAEAGGSLLVHYQTPLSDGREVFMMMKSGTYTSFTTWETQTWSMRKFAWEGGQLMTQWTTASDWDPVPAGGARFEPVFHGALGNGHVYLPGRGGTVLELDRTTGAILRRLGQFTPQIDGNTYVISPIVIGDDGAIVYNTLKLPGQNPWIGDLQGAWLVRITPDGTASRVSYQDLVPGGPAPAAQCLNEFSVNQLPWPPSPNAVPPSVTCGSQRSSLNLAPAIAADGTIYTASRTHMAGRWAWLIAVNPDLTLKWSSSLRNLFADGCNVLLPPNGQAGGCRNGATTGVDPADNQFGSGLLNSNSTASPVIAPDGTIYLGTYSRYNHSRGHTVRFDAAGQFLSAYPFGWDVTPAIWEHDGTFSVLTKENRYFGVGSYCSQPSWCPDVHVPGDEAGYFISQLSPELTANWRFKSTNTQSCTRQPNGSVTCVSDRPEGFEWCVNALAVDTRGVVYVNSEDGNLYAINPDGTLRENIFLQLAVAAAYTPLSLGADGKVYTQNAGHLFVVGSDAPRRRAVAH